MRGQIGGWSQGPSMILPSMSVTTRSSGFIFSYGTPLGLITTRLSSRAIPLAFRRYKEQAHGEPIQDSLRGLPRGGSVVSCNSSCSGGHAAERGQNFSDFHCWSVGFPNANKAHDIVRKDPRRRGPLRVQARQHGTLDRVRSGRPQWFGTRQRREPQNR